MKEEVLRGGFNWEIEGMKRVEIRACIKFIINSGLILKYAQIR